MTLRKIFKILPYYIVAWASRQYGADCELKVKGVKVAKAVKAFHVHAGEYIIFSEESQREYEKKKQTRIDRKKHKDKIKRNKKLRKIRLALYKDKKLRDLVKEDIDCVIEKEDD